jgi:2,3-dihydroxybenzoate-AMP ligase
VGSQRFAPELSRRARSELKCKITQWFGMAEGLLTFTRLSDPETIVDNTQGRPLCPDDELRVVDERDRPLGAGRVGELLTRGPYTIRGYYRADDHNSRAFSADGFLRTGDLVQITSEGNLVVEGRLKDVINRGGEKVSAAELEDLLLEHPAVRQVAAVAMPDEAMGERVALFVVARAEAPELRELRRFLRERGLADYKLPDRLELLPTLPQTQVGKVNKAALRELLRAQGGSAA